MKSTLFTHGGGKCKYRGNGSEKFEFHSVMDYEVSWKFQVPVEPLKKTNPFRCLFMDVHDVVIVNRRNTSIYANNATKIEYGKSKAMHARRRRWSPRVYNANSSSQQ